MNEINIKDSSKVSWETINKYVHNNLIICNRHLEHDIYILNYTPKTQYKQFWDDVTLSCRGLVIDGEGNIIAKPLQKFKNIEEHHENEFDLNQDFEVFEKMDGSLIILFYYEKTKTWIYASRGSFISEQAKEAKKMFTRHLENKLDKKFTYVFEILYKNNRIVVNYGNEEKMVLLAKIETKTGKESFYDDLVDKYSKHFNVVERVYVNILNSKHNTVKSLYDLKKNNLDNKEGYVVKFLNGKRVKVKFEEYVRLHRIITNVSNLTVWEHLKNEYDFDELVDRVPDEFYEWLKETISSLENQYYEIERKAMYDFIKIFYFENKTNRSEFADEAKKSSYTSILFKLYDKKKYNEIIWKMLRPTFSKPFKDGYNLDEVKST